MRQVSLIRSTFHVVDKVSRLRELDSFCLTRQTSRSSQLRANRENGIVTRGKSWFSASTISARTFLSGISANPCNCPSIVTIFLSMYVTRKNKKVKGIFLSSCASCVPENPIYIKSFTLSFLRIALKSHPSAPFSESHSFSLSPPPPPSFSVIESTLKVKKGEKSGTFTKYARASIIPRRIIRDKKKPDYRGFPVNYFILSLSLFLS